LGKKLPKTGTRGGKNRVRIPKGIGQELRDVAKPKRGRGWRSKRGVSKGGGSKKKAKRQAKVRKRARTDLRRTPHLKGQTLGKLLKKKKTCKKNGV